MAVLSEDITTRPAAEAYVERVCFKVGPPTLVGAELEWFTATADGSRPSLRRIADALGDHSPVSISPLSSAAPLPSGGSVSVEPGGQIEISSLPADSAFDVCAALSADERALRDLLSRADIAMRSGAADTERGPERLLVLDRYCAMESRFDTVGPYGRLMMCNTAAVQVSVDAGADTADVDRRWKVLHHMGPALLAAFATSPELRGVPGGSWASQRMRTWLELDRTRTRAPLGRESATEYARWALDVPLLCVRSDSGSLVTPPPGATFFDWMNGGLDDVLRRRPGTSDLDYHLTTLFPMVRPSGHFEVRYLDGQPDGRWRHPVVAVDSLLRSDAAIDDATAAVRGTEELWEDAARLGLGHPELRAAAADVLAAAAEHGTDSRYRALLAGESARCRDGRTPTEEESR